MLGDELDRPTPVRSFHPARNFLRRTRAAQVDAELRAVVEDVNVGGGMVVRVDPDNEPLDNDPRHDLSVTYRVRFYNSGTVRRSLTSVVLKAAFGTISRADRHADLRVRKGCPKIALWETRAPARSSTGCPPGPSGHDLRGATLAADDGIEHDPRR